MLMPSMTSPSSISRRAAHCEQTVTEPPSTSAASSSASGVARGSQNSSARPGSANHAASPVIHKDTSAPLARAAEATVNAWLQRSESSVPHVTFTTRERVMGAKLALGGKGCGTCLAVS